MNWQDDIFQTVLQAKCIAACWSTNLISQELAGGDIACCEKKLMLLSAWIDQIESYYCTHFNGDYGNITPDYDCLTLAQAQEFLGKLKVLIEAE